MTRALAPHGVRAVLFDLVGTLTTAVSARQRNAGHQRVADVLGVPADAYLSVLLDSYVERASGRRGSMEQTMRWVARHAGSDPSHDHVTRACAIRLAAERTHLRMRADAVRVLATLRAMGIRTGVISDCTHEVPALWSSLPISRHVDVAVFSVEVGACKPDVTVYATACRRLGVTPADCVYVGDGGSQELSGAQGIGMFAVRLVAPDSHQHVAHLTESDWRGPSIRSLSELLPIVSTLNDAADAARGLPRQRTSMTGHTAPLSFDATTIAGG